MIAKVTSRIFLVIFRLETGMSMTAASACGNTSRFQRSREMLDVPERMTHDTWLIYKLLPNKIMKTCRLWNSGPSLSARIALIDHKMPSGMLECMQQSIAVEFKKCAHGN